MDLHSSNPLFKVNWISSLYSADYSQTQCWVTDAGQRYMLHDSIGKKLTNKQNYAVQSQHSAGPWVFLWKGSWDGGSRLFLDLGVGYVSVFSLWKFWGLYSYDLCIFCMYVILWLKIYLKFLGETKPTTLKLQKLTISPRNKKNKHLG